MNFDQAQFLWGQPGIPGTGITSGEVATINSRLSALEGLTPPTVLDDLSDVTMGTPSTGQIMRFNGTQWVNYTPAATTFTVGLPIVLDGGGAVLTTGTKLTGIEVPFACTVTGWTCASPQSGDIEVTVGRATYAAHPTYTDISGTEKPRLTGGNRSQDVTLTTWNTSLAAGDLLNFTITGTPATIQQVVVNLRLSRSV